MEVVDLKIKGQLLKALSVEDIVSVTGRASATCW